MTVGWNDGVREIRGAVFRFKGATLRLMAYSTVVDSYFHQLACKIGVRARYSDHHMVFSTTVLTGMKRISFTSGGWYFSLWVAVIAGLLVLHGVHLGADFPNYSPWMDYSKYTDEGWYGKAAIEHYVLGSWYVRGDFNPGVALPVLPALEWIVFRFTGVSLVAARWLLLCVFAANLFLAYRIARMRASRLAAMLAVTLLAVNAFLYAFSRLAILEMLLILFLLASWLLALHLREAANADRRAGLLAAIGLLLCLMVLTKTTAIFVAPSTLLIICAGCGYKLREGVRALSIACAAGAVPWLAYYVLLVRPRYLFDYHYLFEANRWDHPQSIGGWLAAFWYSVHGCLWIDGWLCGVALLLLCVSAMLFRRLFRDPLIGASLLTIAGYLFFIGWHNNMQPRYYEVVAFPLVFLISLGLEFVLRARSDLDLMRGLRVPLAGICVLSLATSTVLNLRQVFHWARHPEYTWIAATQDVTRYIDAHPNGNRLLLSISGDNITLVTHLPAICDDFGTWDLPLRIHHYQPGWYAAWNELDPGTLQDLQTQYSLEQVAVFPAFDDPDRNQLMLYKLHPLPSNEQHYDEALEDAGNAGR